MRAFSTLSLQGPRSEMNPRPVQLTAGAGREGGEGSPAFPGQTRRTPHPHPLQNQSSQALSSKLQTPAFMSPPTPQVNVLPWLIYPADKEFAFFLNDPIQGPVFPGK